MNLGSRSCQHNFRLTLNITAFYYVEYSSFS